MFLCDDITNSTRSLQDRGVSLISKRFSLETKPYNQIVFFVWKLCSRSCNFNFISKNYKHREVEAEWSIKNWQLFWSMLEKCWGKFLKLVCQLKESSALDFNCLYIFAQTNCLSFFNPLSANPTKWSNTLK